MIVSSFLYATSDDDPIYAYAALKVGYGSEVGGIGAGLDMKWAFLGLYGGLGWFSELGGAIGVKLHLVYLKI